MANPLTKSEVTALLGRSLSKIETANFTLYLNIAKMRLTDLLCYDFTKNGDVPVVIPDDLGLVWARFFDGFSKEQKVDNSVASKRVEDFQIAFREDYSPIAELLSQNQATIAKYSKCVSSIRHGRTIFDAGGLR